MTACDRTRRGFQVAAGLLAALMAEPVTGAAPGDGLLPYDTRWQHPHFLTFRPANGRPCRVNPPRLSWPYVPQVLVGRWKLPPREFTLQLAKRPDFTKPDIEVRTPLNFYNALPVLDEGRWFWRVGYDAGAQAEHWSAVRSFLCDTGTVEWDRTVIHRAAKLLAGRRHPRLGPPKGDWHAWRKELAAGKETGEWLREAIRGAERAARRPWWKKLPPSDRKSETHYGELAFRRMAADAALCAFVARLTGQPRYAPAKQQALALGRFPPGGQSSPEYNGQSPTKWPTQITEYLAVVYDVLHDQLSADERATLLKSVEWRLRAVYLNKYSWQGEGRVHRQGVACFAQSHPYENFVWSLPAVLLTAGDLPLADELTPLCLNYLTGVTSAHGPDEGWNEGLCYGAWKGLSMMKASAYTALLLPELKLHRSPYYPRLGRWYAHLLPLGIHRLSFGDYAATPDRALASQRNIFRFLSWFSEEDWIRRRLRGLVAMKGERPSARPWLDLLCAARPSPSQRPKDAVPRPRPRAARQTVSALFPEAGWVMVSSRSPCDREAFDDAVGMIFKCRPRGGYSHSFRSENDFVWHAYGQTLSASGGGTIYPDVHSRSTLSHNCVLVNGVGQEWNPWSPRRSCCGRLIAYQAKAGFVHWVGDATAAYQTVGDLLRVHRHVVFVDNRWFAVFDDLAVRPEGKPARFSWLFHVHPSVALEIDASRPGLAYRMGDVHARVVFGNPPESVQIRNMPGRKGFVNLLTGEDMYDDTVGRLASRGRKLESDQWMAHNVWVTSRRPARAFAFPTALLAWRDGEKPPRISFPGPAAVRVQFPGAAARTVSFAPAVKGDLNVDLARVRRHAMETDPDVLPPTGPAETIKLGGETYKVQWLARETFDRPDWVNRWFVEGDSHVWTAGRRLCVRKSDPNQANVATIWYRPELPADAIVRFRAAAVEPAESNAANLNLFLHARELDGAPVRFGRSGQYKEYHEIPNYIVTFVGGHRPGWSRVRRDPGFNLLHEADVRSEVGKVYRIAVALQGGRLRYYVDGRKLHDVKDPKPLPGGRFAIRTWSTNAWWADVDFGRIMPADRPAK